MTCNACGEKPKDTAKDFTKAVIEINNPETLVLLRKVVIPVSMGTEEDVPAAIGKYHNVILHYEANKHTYLYSSDGIPTLLEMEVPQEVWDSIDELQEEIDEIKNSPDVVDIVDTYADLESYDTSELGDKDVIRVLNDETHDGESSYYRWNTATQTWTFIGATGPYYTKGQTDDLLNEKQDSLTAGDNITIENNVISAESWITDLTDADYDYPDNNPDGVAVWSLPTGMYRAPNGVNIYNDSATSGSSGNRIFFVNSDLPGSNSIIYYPGASIALSVVNKSTGSLVLDTSTLLTSQVVDALTSTATNVPLSAYQGKVLKDMIDGLPSIPTVVQDTGSSTTDVMSQKAVRDLIFNASFNPDEKNNIRIGYQAAAYNNSVAIGNQANSGRINSSAVVIGNKATAAQGTSYAISIGDNSNAGGNGTICIGNNTSNYNKGCIMLGAYCSNYTSNNGVMYISTSNTDYGYNNSQYRLLTGVYDPQNAHDAATKGYVDPSTSTTAPTTSTTGRLGEIRIDTSTNTAYMCVSADSTTSTFIWKQITA